MPNPNIRHQFATIPENYAIFADSNHGGVGASGVAQFAANLVTVPSGVLFDFHAGTLAVDTQDLSMELGGTTVGTQYDRLTASGTATLAGTLDVTLINGFTPKVGDSFLLVRAGTLTGSCLDVILPKLTAEQLAVNQRRAVTQTGSDFSITVVPEPATGVLGLCALGLAVGLRRRKSVS